MIRKLAFFLMISTFTTLSSSDIVNVGAQHAMLPVFSAPPAAPLPFIHQIGPADWLGGFTGAAIFDYDNDGDFDIYITNGDGFPNALLENDGSGQFKDVAVEAKVDDRGRGHGVVTADYNNDGYVDIYVCNDGFNILYKNNGDKTFTDVSKIAKVEGNSNSNSAAFADIDNDGYLDLFVANAGFKYGECKLYRNKGDGTFTDITDIAKTFGGYAWAGAFFDYDNDGDQDLLVANDQGLTQPGERCTIALYRNEGKLRFTDVTKEAGLDVTGSWMGIAISDYDNDGDLDFFVTNLGTSTIFERQETDLHVLYENQGNGKFIDVSEKAGVKRWEFGWGCSFLDYDNDGLKDLYYAGNFDLMNAKDNPGRLFLNKGDKTFIESSAKFGLFNRDESGKNREAKGICVGDLNEDGFLEILISNSGVNNRLGQITPGIPTLFWNKPNQNNWIKIRLEGVISNRNGIGARVKVTTPNGFQIDEVRSGSSCFSQDSLELAFGLKDQTQADIEVRWPSGLTQNLPRVRANQTVSIVEIPRQGVSTVDIEPKSHYISSWGDIKRDVLLQNYPNPFNPETWIPYALGEDSQVAIKIYDSTGKMVRQLLLGRKKAGGYIEPNKAAKWDGKNEMGDPVSSGIYFYTLQAKHFVDTKKMIVVK